MLVEPGGATPAIVDRSLLSVLSHIEIVMFEAVRMFFEPVPSAKERRRREEGVPAERKVGDVAVGGGGANSQTFTCAWDLLSDDCRCSVQSWSLISLLGRCCQLVTKTVSLLHQQRRTQS